MTRDQALAILAYDIADLIGRNDGYDGLIPDDADLTQDSLIKLLPDLFRAAGFDPFKPSKTQTELAVEWPHVEHTCNPKNPGKPLPFGRKAPRGQCPSCDQLYAGRPPREAHPAIQAANRRRDNDERARHEWDDHVARKHHNGRCADGPVCTFGQW
jgi:hypothetical protein